MQFDPAAAAEAHQKRQRIETQAQEIRAALAGPIGNTLSQHHALISGEKRRISIKEHLERLGEEVTAQLANFQAAGGESALDVYKQGVQGISYAGEIPAWPQTDRTDFVPFDTLP